MTPTQRSLAMLRKDGWTVAVVEKWVPYPPPGHRVDVWGFGDLLAVHPATGETVLIQTTSGPNLAARRTKIESIPEAGLWLECGNTIYLHGWRKTKPRGQTVPHWDCRVEEIKLFPEREKPF